MIKLKDNTLSFKFPDIPKSVAKLCLIPSDSAFIVLWRLSFQAG